MTLRGFAIGTTAIATVLVAAAAQAQQTGTSKTAEPAQTEEATPTPDAPAAEESATNTPRTEIVSPTGTPGTSANDLIVIGIRGSVSSAANKKRNAKQIVDSVVSEDVGKLPDNNVPEAIARLTGVQITRERGQGQSIAIRGLTGVQTTVNGNNANLGAGRALNLADIPSELVKSVDVYKTRSADQVEGSIAGAVNVELRRPLDLKKGLTLAGSARGLYDDLAEKVSPFVSVLVGQHFETPIGDMGFLVNGSWTRQNYFETYIQSESPDTVCCDGDENTAWGRLPDNLKDIIVPFAARSGLEEGRVDRPSLNVSLQWAPDDNLQFVLEGLYSGARSRNEASRYYALLRQPELTLSNIQLQPDGQTVNRLTLSGPAGQIPVGIDNSYSRSRNDFYQINGEMRWTSERAVLTASALYSWSRDYSRGIFHLPRPPALSTTTVDFTTNVGGYNVPVVTLDGIDMTNIANYGLERFQDNRDFNNNKEFASQADLTLNFSETGLLRSLQTGVRANRRNVYRRFGYRDGFPRIDVDGENVFAPLADLPGADRAVLVGPKISGAQQWLRIPGEVLFNNIGAIRAYIQQADSNNGDQFATEFPSGDLGSEFTSRENSFAMYGQLNWGLDIGFPIDGFAGVRYVNTWGSFNGSQYLEGPSGVIISPSRGRANFVDILPSFAAVLHFTPKAQLRLSYSTNVQRAGFDALRPFFYVNPQEAVPTVFAGNPELEPERSHAFDASAEYYFGRGGQINLAGFYKRANGFIYEDREEVADLVFYGLPGRPGFVQQPRNGGRGEFLGLEGMAQSFFDFLPGKLRNFGAMVNATHIFKARIEYPFPEEFPGAYDSPDTSKWTLNAALFYDTPQFSTRIAYNYRSPFREGIWFPRPEYTIFTDATERLDAAVNYTPVQWMTLSLEATNLTGNDVYRYFGKENLLGAGVRLQARTIQGSVRVRY